MGVHLEIFSFLEFSLTVCVCVFSSFSAASPVFEPFLVFTPNSAASPVFETFCMFFPILAASPVFTSVASSVLCLVSTVFLFLSVQLVLYDHWLLLLLLT